MSAAPGDLTARGIIRRLDLLCPARGRLVCLGPGSERVRAAATARGWVVDDHPGRALAAVWSGTDLASTPIDLPEGVRVLVMIGPAADPGDGWSLVRDRPHQEYLTLHEWMNRGLAPRLRRRLAPLLDAAWFQKTVSARVAKIRVTGVRERWFLRNAAGSATRDPAVDRLRDLAMSFLGIGHLPLLAANWASLATVAIAALALGLGGMTAYGVACWGLVGAATAACVAFERWSARHYLTPDAREVVLDEVAGMSLALGIVGPAFGEWAHPMTPASLPWAELGLVFLAFRFFDIFKPGIHWIERTGWRGTIVWDDLLAGLFAGMATRGLLTIL